MDPMTVFFSILLIFFLAMQGWSMFGPQKPRITPSEPLKAIETREHALAKTWMESNPLDKAWEGWRWKCVCGVQGIAENISKTSLGTETNAITQFQKHVSGYKLANGNEYKDKYEELLKKYNKSQKDCICKEL